MPILSQLKGERGFISVSVSLQNSVFFHFSLSWCRADETKENHRTITVNVLCRLLQVWFHKKRSFTCSMLIHPNDLFTTLLSENRASGWGGWEGSSIMAGCRLLRSTCTSVLEQVIALLPSVCVWGLGLGLWLTYCLCWALCPIKCQGLLIPWQCY